MANLSPLDLLGLTVNPATGPETIGVAYNYDTKFLHRFENAQIFSFFEKIANCYTITVSHTNDSWQFFSPHYEIMIQKKSITF